MKYLILGGNGFIGSAVRDNLLCAGHSVLTFGLGSNPGCSALNGTLAHLQGDFATYEHWGPVLEEHRTVFHCISTSTPSSADADPLADLKNNCAPLVNFLSFAARAGVKVVFVSSAGTVYGPTTERYISETHSTNPVCAYGVGKLAMEKYLAFYGHRYGLRYAIARVSNAFGERQNLRRAQGIVGVFLRKAIAGETIEVWGDGGIVRDFIYVGDVAEALVRMACYTGSSPLFNIGSSEGRTVNEIIGEIEKAIGRPVTRKYKPSRLEDVPYNVLLTEKAKIYLGWEPAVSFEQGMARSVTWIRNEISGRDLLSSGRSGKRQIAEA
jgi:UDP-glucose 4-epimerase